MQYSAPQLADTDARKVLASFLLTGDYVDEPAGVLSGGEKTILAMEILVVPGANALSLDEPTNKLDPSNREEILRAQATLSDAVVLERHDVGAFIALNPERVLILPDGDEGHWSEDYEELISLSWGSSLI